MKPNYRAIKHNTHPGEIFSEFIIKSNNLSVDKASKLLGVSRPNLSNVVNGKSAISPLMAIRISKVFGGNPAIWIRLQIAYDLREAEIEFAKKDIHLEKFETA